MSILKIEINAFICGKPVLVLLLFFKDIIELINQFYFGCAGFVAVLAFLQLQRVEAILQLKCVGVFSLRWLILLQGTGSVVVQGLSCSTACGMVLGRGLNLCLLHWHWRRKWQPTPVFLPGESQGQRSLVGCSVWGRTESDMTEVTQQQQQPNKQLEKEKLKRSLFRDMNKIGFIGLFIKMEIPNRNFYMRRLVLRPLRRL